MLSALFCLQQPPGILFISQPEKWERAEQQLFRDAKNIADLLVAVMDRKTQELKERKQSLSRVTQL
jgi:hypothetical protein